MYVRTGQVVEINGRYAEQVLDRYTIRRTLLYRRTRVFHTLWLGIS